MSDVNEAINATQVQMAKVNEDIKKIGITPSNIEQVKRLIERYQELQSDLTIHRESQFYQTARSFFAQGVTRRNQMDALSTFLRELALHWTGEILNHLGYDSSPTDESLEEIVDSLTNIVEDEDE